MSGSTCQNIRGYYTTSAGFNEFKSLMQPRLDAIGAYFMNGLEADLQLLRNQETSVGSGYQLARFVQIVGKPNDWLNFAQIQVYNGEMQLISNNKPTAASSVYNAGTPASKSVNGNTTQNLGFHSGFSGPNLRDNNPWWRVDLGTPTTVSKIIFFNRKDCCQSRIVGAKLQILDTEKRVLWTQDFTNPSLVQEFTMALPAEAATRVAQNVNQLKQTETDILQLNRCLTSELQERQRLSYDVYQKQKELQSTQDETETAKSVRQAAEERAAEVTNPYQNTTTNQSWFPLGRPLEETSIPVLLGLSLLFLTAALGFFLHMASLDIEFKSRLVGEVGAGSGFVLFENIAEFFRANVGFSWTVVAIVVALVLAVLFLGLRLGGIL